jgi:hypothetical protein
MSPTYCGQDLRRKVGRARLVGMFEQDSVVRFNGGSRFNDWQKGDLGKIVKVIALPPQNQRAILVIEVRGKKVWATSEDVAPFNQLSLF